MSKICTWPPLQIKRMQDALDELGIRVDSTRDTEVLPWLTRMLVVRSSGFIEQTSREVFRGYVEERSGGPVRSFSHSWLEKSRNPSPDSLLEMVGRFDHKFRSDLEELLESEDQRLRRELAFLVDRRNSIAHGLNESINREKALSLKAVAVEISDWLVLKFNPLRP